LVLKLMKHEHELDRRNLDRHRREALVMDRLTSSPYVANLYGFCGTTVLTEFLGQTLRDLLKESDEDEGRPSLAVGPSRGAGRSPAAPLGRSTPRGRLRLALHAARGVRALHESSVVHADVQEQQFLVGWSSSSESESDPQPRLVLNDFNRCRFLAHRVSGGTNESARKTRCPFRIPSAPGSSRAPEEYAFEDLTEQIDVYSLGNVLHQILTGEDPWGGWSVLEVTNQVQKGIKPVAPPEMLEHPSDVLLQNLTLRAYELDPEVRIRAKELVQQLEWAMSAYFGGE
jgi:serine/threonine protein kinase